MIKKSSKLTKKLFGTVEIPADKSLSHRAVMLASLADGTSIINNFSAGKDPLSSLEVCRSLGVNIEFIDDKTLKINSNGCFKRCDIPLDCGNSGTTMRLMTGILAGQSFNSVLTGDESLSKRPMKRIIEPLTLMGAEINSNQNKAPLCIKGKKLSAINYISPISSAQVKSCILLAGLQAVGKTVFSEPFLSRNHTEIMLKYMGADIDFSDNHVSVSPSVLQPKTLKICGDISSAAYFIAAGLIVSGSKIILKNVGVNPTRTGFIDVIHKMGGNIEILNKVNVCGEDVADLKVEASDLKSCTIEGEIIPRLIDELPLIAVLATCADGQTIVKDAQDLRNKESDRIKNIVYALKKLGADITETPDGFIVNGKTPLRGGAEIESFNDHRIAMSMFIAGLVCDDEIAIKDFEWVNISFPEFECLFEKLKSD